MESKKRKKGGQGEEGKVAKGIRREEERSYEWEKTYERFKHQRTTRARSNVIGHNLENPRNYTNCIVQGCNKGYYSKRELIQHYLQTHKLDVGDVLPKSQLEFQDINDRYIRSHYCVVCKLRFPTERDEMFHTMDQHVPDSFKKYKCQVCDRKFVLQEALEEHVTNNHK